MRILQALSFTSPSKICPALLISRVEWGILSAKREIRFRDKRQVHSQGGRRAAESKVQTFDPLNLLGNASVGSFLRNQYVRMAELGGCPDSIFLEEAQMKANIAIQILPTGLNDADTVRVVDEVIAYIQSTGLSYYVGPSETSIEGDDLHQLVDILENCIRIANKAGSEKVYAYTKLTYKSAGGVLTIDEKITKHHQ